MADWIALTLGKLGAPDNSTNRVALSEWAASEGMPASANNPLAASDQIAGATPTPGFSEPTYPSADAAATLYARKFQIEPYVAIGFALKVGDNLNLIFDAINKSPWCAGCQGGNYPVVLYNTLAGGNIAPPPPPHTTRTTHPNLPNNPMTKAWMDLMRTLAVTAPKSLREAQHARARMRRAVR